MCLHALCTVWHFVQITRNMCSVQMFNFVLLLLQGSVTRITLTVPYKDKKMGTANAASAAAPAPALAPSQALPDLSSYVPPSRPASQPLGKPAGNPGYPMPNLPQPTDPRRAAAARASNPAPAGQIGQYPGQIGAGAGATSSGSGQYPTAAGLGPTGVSVGVSGQSGRGMPMDPRADPRVDSRTDPRTKSAFRPAGVYAGVLFVPGCLLFMLALHSASLY